MKKITLKQWKEIKETLLNKYNKVNFLPYPFPVDGTRVDCYSRNGRRMEVFFVEEVSASELV